MTSPPDARVRLEPVGEEVRPPTDDALAPYLTARITASLLGRTMTFRTAPGLFSTDRIDDGTRALLASPVVDLDGPVLDLGCGAGPLGLALAAARPGRRVTCTDRDALAAAVCAFNARANGFPEVETRAGVGVDAVESSDFAIGLCNVPARIGDAGIGRLVNGLFARLRPGGRVGLVVITDLAAAVERLSDAHGWVVGARHDATRHAVFELTRGAAPTRVEDAESAGYVLDRVTVRSRRGDLTLDRHSDASEEPTRATEGLPLLLDCLPSRVDRALSWRGGAGAVAMALATSGARVLVADRDTLALAFVRRNTRGAAGEVVTVTAAILDLVSPQNDALVVGEYAPVLGTTLGAHELNVARRLAGPRGEVLWLVHAKATKELLRDSPGAVVLAGRGRWAVLRAPGAATGQRAKRRV